MSSLDPLIAATRDVVARRKAEVPARALENRPAFQAPTLSLAAALRRPSDRDGLAAPAVIAEVRKPAPASGPCRTEFNPVELARQYKTGGAAAIAVVTDPIGGGGTLGHLAAVRLASDLPLLCLDLIVDAYQLVEARAHGADAVLLLAAALDPVQFRDLHAEAAALGLGCLVEIRDACEAERLDFDRVQMLSVRDHGRAPVELPAHVVQVDASGLRSAEELATVRRRGRDAALVGEPLLRAPEPGRALRRLRHEADTLLAAAYRLAS